MLLKNKSLKWTIDEKENLAKEFQNHQSRSAFSYYSIVVTAGNLLVTAGENSRSLNLNHHIDFTNRQCQ